MSAPEGRSTVILDGIHEIPWIASTNPNSELNNAPLTIKVDPNKGLDLVLPFEVEGHIAFARRTTGENEDPTVTVGLVAEDQDHGGFTAEFNLVLVGGEMPGQFEQFPVSDILNLVSINAEGEHSVITRLDHPIDAANGDSLDYQVFYQMVDPDGTMTVHRVANTLDISTRDNYFNDQISGAEACSGIPNPERVGQNPPAPDGELIPSDSPIPFEGVNAEELIGLGIVEGNIEALEALQVVGEWRGILERSPLQLDFVITE